MPISTSARSARAVLAVLAVVAPAACGGSGSTTPSRTASPTTTTTVTRTASASHSSETTAPASASSTSTSSGPPPCRAAGLALAFLGQQGATGHGELGFALRNTGSRCNTIGYPGVLFLSRSGAPLPTSPSHTTSDFFGHSPLGELIVAPGQTASFRLGVTHGIPSSAGCTTAYGVQVIPPNDTATLRVSIPGGASECTTATVSPLRVGTSAYP